MSSPADDTVNKDVNVNSENTDNANHCTSSVDSNVDSTSTEIQPVDSATVNSQSVDTFSADSDSNSPKHSALWVTV
ncbi:MAG: hypothetical protein K2L34_10895, partial [Muribaculaceae bacterium]|nr:hypothetical protein [Muribaculaceae bacterium]